MRGQVIVKGQENPLTGDKKRTKNFNVRHKSVVEFEPDLKLKKLKESTTTGRITKQKNRLKPEATDATTTTTDIETNKTTTTNTTITTTTATTANTTTTTTTTTATTTITITTNTKNF